jgi:hypothetical protein
LFLRNLHEHSGSSLGVDELHCLACRLWKHILHEMEALPIPTGTVVRTVQYE